MDSLYQLALSSQTICGGIQFLLFSISLGAVIGALQHYHANDRLTFNCSPKPSDFTKQLCYDKYTSTVSPWLIPRNIAAIAYAVVFACWICFMLYGAVTLRQIRRQQPEQNRRHRQLRKFIRVYFVHVCFRLVFLGVMIGLFCSYQTLDLPSVFKCGPSVPQTNTTSIPVNQTETGLQCNDLHYKEKSNLNIAIIVIEASILMLAILEAIHLSLTRETFMEKLLGDVFDVGNNIEMESVLSRNEATDNNPSVVFAYTKALKESSKHQTEFQRKLIASPTISSMRTDEIFTNILIQQGRKPVDDIEMKRKERLGYYGQVSGNRVKHCEEIFIRRTSDEEENPKSILLTGKAGIGKSLFCQKLIRDWADNKLFQSQDVRIPDFKFAYLLTFRQLSLLGNDYVTLREILNCSSLLDDHSNIDDSLFDYILNHPEEVLIIIDGYDEYSLQHYIAGDYEEQYPNNSKEKMPVAALCAKLIKGKILRDAVVMITSRPDESDKIGGIDFDRYVEITGFSAQQVKQYIEKYFKENNTMKNAVLEHVMNNDILLSFAHIPVLCFLMCWYMKYTLTESKITDDLPVSATDIYSAVVRMFELKHNAETKDKSKEIPERPTASDFIEGTLDKLSDLAAQMLLQRKPIFDERDMEEKFNSEEVEELKASGLLHCGPPFRKSAFETTKHFCFTHFTVQEFLAARWFVAKREIPDENVSAMVMQFMAGILSKKKDETLMDRLLENISSGSKSSSRNILLRAKCLNEYQEKKFAKNFIKNHYHKYFDSRKIVFDHLTEAECFAISFLLDIISELNEEEAIAEHQTLTERPFSIIKSVDFYQSDITLAGITRVCKSLKKPFCSVTELSLGGNTLTDACIDCISGIVSSKLTELSIYFAMITDAGVASLCNALSEPNCKVTTLHLTGSAITDAGVASLCKSLKQPTSTLTTLDLYYIDLTDTGVAGLCQALTETQCKVTTLDLGGNEITDAGVAIICQTLLKEQSCKVTTLKMSQNTNTSMKSEEALRSMVQKYRPDLNLEL